MSRSFEGFQHGPFHMVKIPAPFFSEALPLIDNLAELKVVLFCFWTLPQKESSYPYLRLHDFTGSEALMQGLASANPEGQPEDTLHAALERATDHGILLAATVRLDPPETLYFVNTERGRAAVAQIQAGRWQPGDQDDPVEILPERPNIFSLYEQNIGQLTPMIADELKDIEQDFPATWAEEAITIAVKNNKRSLSYIRAILERWRKEGKDGGEIPGRRDEEDWKRYVSGRYADFINH